MADERTIPERAFRVWNRMFPALADDPTPATIASLRRQWFQILALDARAADDARVTCRGCGRRSHHTHVCQSAPVCNYCDEYVQPMPANPRNERYVRARLPEHIADALFAPQTLTEQMEHKLVL